MSAETVANRTYPLIRDAYVYVNRAPGKPMDPKVKEFLRFVLSREGQQIIADTDMYYALTPDALREQLKKLDFGRAQVDSEAVALNAGVW
jgi:phosphate transport system substrate-binding protein